jgi:hypothetical protein
MSEKAFEDFLDLALCVYGGDLPKRVQWTCVCRRCERRRKRNKVRKAEQKRRGL